MLDRERVVVSGVFTVLLIAWLGFLVHRSPRFPGSGLGAVFGIAAAVVMSIPLAYPIVKRTPRLSARVTRHVSMHSLLAAHIYAGTIGPLLAILHTGHKFDSRLGISLTAVMLLLVVSGFAARYLLTYASREITDKLLLLQTARGDLDSVWGRLETAPSDMRTPPRWPLFAAGLASVGVELPIAGPAGEVARIAESIADLEYAIRTHELLKRWFARSLNVHILLSVLFYLLLCLHIGSEVYFGLRWMR